MTVLIAGTVDILDGDRDKALADAAALIADTRAQQGCQHYVWSADPTSDTRVYVYEYWDSVEDLAAHLAGPYYMGMLQLLGQYEMLGTDILKYETAKAGPIYDDTGVPRADFFATVDA